MARDCLLHSRVSPDGGGDGKSEFSLFPPASPSVIILCIMIPVPCAAGILKTNQFHLLLSQRHKGDRSSDEELAAYR